MTRIDVVAYSATEFVEDAHIDFEGCAKLIEKYPVTWINVVDLAEGDLPAMERLFKLHPIALEDSIDQSQLPKVDEYDEEVFLITKIIHWKDGGEYRPDQLSMFVSKKFVITIHPEELPQIAEVKQRLRKGSPRMLRAGPDYLCLNVLDAVVDSYLPMLDHISDLMDELEDEVVDKPNRDILSRVHNARRTILHLRKDINPQREALHILWRTELPYFKKETRGYIRDVYDHTSQFLEFLETYRELTADVYQIYLSGVQVQLNEVMRLLTVIATIGLPMALASSLYGMNFQDLPLEDNPLGFWLVTGITGSMMAIMVYLFRRKGWF